ncbi:MAG TPA: ABC transporter permease, partial [Acidimicrobiia bacterium]
MGRYIARRLLWVLLVVILVTFLTFLIFFVIPPVDPAILFAGRAPSQRLIEEVRVSLGLNHSFWVQYALFLKRIFLGDQYGWPGFGLSFVTRSP